VVTFFVPAALWEFLETENSPEPLFTGKNKNGIKEEPEGLKPWF
jgi:hypothetical protein